MKSPQETGSTTEGSTTDAPPLEESPSATAELPPDSSAPDAVVEIPFEDLPLDGQIDMLIQPVAEVAKEFIFYAVPIFGVDLPLIVA